MKKGIGKFQENLILDFVFWELIFPKTAKFISI